MSPIFDYDVVKTRVMCPSLAPVSECMQSCKPSLLICILHDNRRFHLG
jgi:hypothetical protein